MTQVGRQYSQPGVTKLFLKKFYGLCTTFGLRHIFFFLLGNPLKLQTSFLAHQAGQNLPGHGLPICTLGALLSSEIATSHVWLLNIWNVAGMTEELKF